MATRKIAEAVLSKHAEQLRRHGAHSLLVQSGEPYGERGHVVVAWVPKGFSGTLPNSLVASIDGDSVSVPVRTEERDRFEAESL